MVAKKVTKKKVTKKRAVKIPKTLGACADRLYKLREERQAIQKAADAIKEEERALTAHLIEQLDADDAEGVKGRIAKVGINRTTVATVSDWPKLHKYILKTKDFSLLQRRMNDAACRELWEDKKNIPGVAPFQVKKVSLTKA